MQKSLNNLLIIKGFICDPGAIQTHDLQNRNLTLYSLSYGAKCGCKSIKKIPFLPNLSAQTREKIVHQRFALFAEHAPRHGGLWR